MARVYFPGCKVRRRYPEASEWLAGQVVARGWADEVAGCCRVDHQKLAPGDDAVCVCMNCMAMIDEDAANGGIANIWQLVDADPGFPLPDYSGHVMGVQDCGRAYDRADVQDAVRSLMRKMGIEVVELPDARGGSCYCGASFHKEVPAQDAGFAPRRYTVDAPARGIFVAREPEEAERLLAGHAAAIPVDEVCCYCFSCEAGLTDAGKRACNIIELVSGRFREGRAPWEA